MDRLEQESIYILREAHVRFRNLAMLWSIGKDSTALLWLARKAFLGRCPMPLVHGDTRLKIPSMVEHRDRIVRERRLTLVVASNEEAIAAGMGPDAGRLECCGALETEAFRRIVAGNGSDAILLGIRRGEERSRSKERVFSPRGGDFSWAYKEQGPEIWGQYNVDVPPGGHVRVHPILDWTELDVWEYIGREGVPVVDLYFARGGKRYRSLGCLPCTDPIPSSAATAEEIIAELRAMGVSERAGRAQDRADAYAMPKLRSDGYM